MLTRSPHPILRLTGVARPAMHAGLVWASYTATASLPRRFKTTQAYIQSLHAVQNPIAYGLSSRQRVSRRVIHDWRKHVRWCGPPHTVCSKRRCAKGYHRTQLGTIKRHLTRLVTTKHVSLWFPCHTVRKAHSYVRQGLMTHGWLRGNVCWWHLSHMVS